MTAAQFSIDIMRVAADAARDKKANNIVAVDVSERLGITDAFLIASADNERQVNAIVDGIEDVIAEKFDLHPVRREGRGEGRWVLLDYQDVVVHVQHDEDRVFYALDRLWSDCPLIDVSESTTAPASVSEEPAETPEAE